MQKYLKLKQIWKVSPDHGAKSIDKKNPFS